MAEETSPYRQSALDALAAQDQLDDMMRLTSPRGWALLAAVWAVVVGVVLWGVGGSVPATVRAQALLTRPGGMWAVQAPAAGQVARVLVAAGDELEAGQPVAVLEPDLQVVTARAGKVLSVLADPGAVVDRGARLVGMSDPSVPMRALLYLPLADAQEVQPGMPVQLALPAFPQEEYGFLMGLVERVGDHPARAEEMLRMLGNQELVDLFLHGRAGSVPLEVRVDLVPDPSAPSGYRWSSGTGPNTRIAGDMLAEASIVVSQEAPLRLLLPGGGR